MSSETQSDDTSRDTSIWQNERLRRVVLYAAVLLAAFLLGLVPMWMTARERGRELNTAQTALRISTLQNTLANAAIDAKQGRLEVNWTAISSARDESCNECQRLNMNCSIG